MARRPSGAEARALPNAAAADDALSPVCFVHIPKTGGTTFHEFLAGHFEPAQRLPANVWHRLLSLPKEQLAGYPFISGHFHGFLHRYLPWPMRYVTLLRDPIERSLSHYAHILREPGHYLHRVAHEAGSLSAYLRHPVLATTIGDWQVNSLTFDFDASALAASLTPEQLAAHELERRMMTSTPSLSANDRLCTAKRRLEQMCCVGVTERMADSMAATCDAFGWERPRARASLNVSPSRPAAADLSHEDLRLLRRLNRGDLALHAHAEQLLNRSLGGSRRPQRRGATTHSAERQP